jgi:hypothetical protein
MKIQKLKKNLKKTWVIRSPSLIEMADLMAKRALPPNATVNACTRVVIRKNG